MVRIEKPRWTGKSATDRAMNELQKSFKASLKLGSVTQQELEREFDLIEEIVGLKPSNLTVFPMPSRTPR